MDTILNPEDERAIWAFQCPDTGDAMTAIFESADENLLGYSTLTVEPDEEDFQPDTKQWCLTHIGTWDGWRSKGACKSVDEAIELLIRAGVHRDDLERAA